MNVRTEIANRLRAEAAKLRAEAKLLQDEAGDLIRAADVLTKSPRAVAALDAETKP